MTFPTKADIEFFKEAKRIQELWEPKFGDYVWDKLGTEILIVTFAGEALLQCASFHSTYPTISREDDAIFLPHQGQLQEMLEERGARGWSVVKIWQGVEDAEPLYQCNCSEISPTFTEGPTPSIALGKCLLEVLDGEKEE